MESKRDDLLSALVSEGYVPPKAPPSPPRLNAMKAIHVTDSLHEKKEISTGDSRKITGQSAIKPLAGGLDLDAQKSR